MRVCVRVCARACESVCEKKESSKNHKGNISQTMAGLQTSNGAGRKDARGKERSERCVDSDQHHTVDGN